MSSRTSGSSTIDFELDGNLARSRWRMVAAILAGHVALCGGLAITLNVWLDEAFSLQTTSGGLAVALRRALHFENQPPLYFLLLAAWRQLHSGYPFARGLSILFTSTALLVVAKLWSRLRPDVHPGWVVAGVAFHPFTVYAAVEIRLYALAFLLSAASLLWFLEEYVSEGNSRARKLAFVATSVAALWTQYYLGFLLAAQGAALLATRRWRPVALYLAAMVVAGAALTPLALQVPGQLQGHSEGVHQELSAVAHGKFVYMRLAYYLLPRETESPPLLKVARDLALLISAIALAWHAIRQPRAPWSAAHQALAIIVGLLVPAFVMALELTGTQDLVLVRHTVALMLPTLLLGFLTVAWAGGSRAVATAALVVLVFEISDLGTTYLPNLAKRGDWSAVARRIEKLEHSGEPVLVFRAPAELPLRIHYHGVNSIVPIPGPNDPEHFLLHDTQLHSETDVLRVIDSLPGHPRRTWLVTDTIWSAMGTDFHHDILEQVVADRFDVDLDERFFASRLRLLRAREPAAPP